jgi:hypothetical protein
MQRASATVTRLTQAFGPGELISGIATAILFLSLFLDWFSIDGVSYGNAMEWDGYLWIVTIVSGLVLVEMAVGILGRRHLLALPFRQVLLGAVWLDLLLVVIAFSLRPSGGPDYHVNWSVGSFLGFASAIVAVVPFLVPALLQEAADTET